MQGEVGVDAAKPGDEMIFERAYRTFSSIAPIDMGWDELKINVGVAHEPFECNGTFVVEPLQLWSESSGDEASMKHLEGG